MIWHVSNLGKPEHTGKRTVSIPLSSLTDGEYNLCCSATVYVRKQLI